MAVNGNSTQSCSRPYSDVYHPCPFPYTSRASSFQLDGSSTACEVTYAESTGALHLSSCIVHTVASTIIAICFLRLFHRAVTRRRDREKGRVPKQAPPASTSTSTSAGANAVSMAKRTLSRGISRRRADSGASRASSKDSFCCGASTIEQAYVCGAAGYFTLALGSVDIQGFGNRLNYAVEHMLSELVYCFYTSIAALVVASWTKASLRQDAKTTRRVDMLLYVSLVAMWCISIVGNVFENTDVRSGSTRTFPMRIKYFMLIFINLIFAASATALGLKLRSKMAKGKASLSRTQSKAAEAQARAVRTISTFSFSISLGLAIVISYRSYKIATDWDSEFRWATPPCNVLDSVVTVPYTGPVVLGTIFLLLLENCPCCAVSLFAHDMSGLGLGGSMLNVMHLGGDSVQDAQKAWDAANGSMELAQPAPTSAPASGDLSDGGATANPLH